MRVVSGGILLWALAAGACNGPDRPVTPTQPTTTAPPPATGQPLPGPHLANWQGDATVVFRSGNGGCGWGTAVGETRTGVLWRVTINGHAILVDEDMSNWPTDHIGYAGTLSGEDFTATYSSLDDYARWVCQFREAHLTGRFRADFSTFEAQETLVWGAPEHETVVRRRWSVSRR